MGAWILEVYQFLIRLFSTNGVRDLLVREVLLEVGHYKKTWGGKGGM